MVWMSSPHRCGSSWIHSTHKHWKYSVHPLNKLGQINISQEHIKDSRNRYQVNLFFNNKKPWINKKVTKHLIPQKMRRGKKLCFSCLLSIKCQVRTKADKNNQNQQRPFQPILFLIRSAGNGSTSPPAAAGLACFWWCQNRLSTQEERH